MKRSLFIPAAAVILAMACTARAQSVSSSCVKEFCSIDGAWEPCGDPDRHCQAKYGTESRSYNRMPNDFTTADCTRPQNSSQPNTAAMTEAAHQQVTLGHVDRDVAGAAAFEFGSNIGSAIVNGIIEGNRQKKIRDAQTADQKRQEALAAEVARQREAARQAEIARQRNIALLGNMQKLDDATPGATRPGLVVKSDSGHAIALLGVDEDGGETAGLKVTSLTATSCYRTEPSKSGCLQIRNNSSLRARLYVEGLPGVQCTADPGSYCTVPILTGPHHLKVVLEDDGGTAPAVGADVNLTSSGLQMTLFGGRP